MARRTRQISTKLKTRKSVVTAPRHVARVGRNDPCPCGENKKYKACCLSKGPEFLVKLAEEQDRQKLKERRQELKDQGVPWHKRLFVR